MKKMIMHDVGIIMTAARDLLSIIRKRSIFTAQADIEVIKRAKDPER